MNDNEQRRGIKYFLLKYGVLFLVFLIIGLGRSLLTEKEYFWIDRKADDTGICLTAKDSYYVTPDFKKHLILHFPDQKVIITSSWI